MNINFDNVSALTFLTVYAYGFVASLTPCVYPLIPITIGFLGANKGSLFFRFLNALMYVLGLSVVYSILGVIAALSGQMFGNLTSNWYVYIIFGVLLLVVGGFMMDWYVIPLPNIMNKFIKKGNTSVFSSFVFGLISGLVASPCTAPLLAGLLMYVSSTKNIIYGSALMFTFSIGMNTLLLIIGVFTNVLLHIPKSGSWLIIVKRVLAMVIILSGVYFIFKAGTLA